MQRRIEQPDRDGQAGHRLEDAFEILLLEREQPFEHPTALVLGRGEDHLPHDREALLGHEHVLGPAEADPLGTELPRLDASSGVSAFARTLRRRNRRPS